MHVKTQSVEKRYEWITTGFGFICDWEKKEILGEGGGAEENNAR